MKANQKLKQHGDVLDELLITAMQFVKQQMVKCIHLPSHTIILLTAVEIEKCRQIMKQQANTTNDRPNQILNILTINSPI